MAELTPMMKQYLEIKEQNGDCLLFFRLGDFYEMFDEDAKLASKELDLALTWHPLDVNSVWSSSSLANYQVRYIFDGVSAHAAANPHHGRSALDAVELMNIGVQFLREHVIQEARLHYAITNSGGFSPNVVQPHAEVLYLIRAPKSAQVEEIYQRVNKIAHGAAMMTETEVTIDYVKGCSNFIPNTVLGDVLQQNLKAVPQPEYTEQEMAFIRELAATCTPDYAKTRATVKGTPEAEEVEAHINDPIYRFVMPHTPGKGASAGSTDVGDVSWVCPTAQIYAATWVPGTPGHSWQVTSQGKSAQAEKGMLYAAKVLAGAAVDLLEHPETVAAAKAEHEVNLEGGKYVCPIPAGIKPRKMSV